MNRKGFTLLEVLVATAILGIAVAVILQLFSANLRAISLSRDYVSASIKAEAKMKEILNSDEKISEKSFSETTDDGYRIDVSIAEALKERTENLQVKLLEIRPDNPLVKGNERKVADLEYDEGCEKRGLIKECRYCSAFIPNYGNIFICSEIFPTSHRLRE